MNSAVRSVRIYILSITTALLILYQGTYYLTRIFSAVFSSLQQINKFIIWIQGCPIIFEWTWIPMHWKSEESKVYVHDQRRWISDPLAVFCDFTGVLKKLKFLSSKSKSLFHISTFFVVLTYLSVHQFFHLKFYLWTQHLFITLSICVVVHIK